jgi:hypothetical protein
VHAHLQANHINFKNIRHFLVEVSDDDCGGQLSMNRFGGVVVIVGCGMLINVCALVALVFSATIWERNGMPGSRVNPGNTVDLTT